MRSRDSLYLIWDTREGAKERKDHRVTVNLSRKGRAAEGSEGAVNAVVVQDLARGKVVGAGRRGGEKKVPLPVCSGFRATRKRHVVVGSDPREGRRKGRIGLEKSSRLSRSYPS